MGMGFVNVVRNTGTSTLASVCRRMPRRVPRPSFLWSRTTSCARARRGQNDVTAILFLRAAEHSRPLNFW